ncbi:hypothetical protein SAMN02745673_03405 [Marinactinospora thermotolerans DSM 45154]|uniref:Glyoxalase-like domain-containing protein n=1 Tax=Marinactinospora thermotolerans DSM 45154 TaxID=1122192 RepID=A0A1T4SDH0_9ACTN|nr:VOC family protein [Marinactinospora thermotolerans]SKA26272.1 hypothetical protein SAMN02745673_03405 [Marinactinospora thermotolerans DSM 45154]
MRLVWVLDTCDAERLAVFWGAALGYERDEADPPYIFLRDPGGLRPDLILQDVPEPKTGKNRMHLDIVVEDLHGEVSRLIGLGAVQRCAPVAEVNGGRLVVMADPEGNEFCVVREATFPEPVPATAKADG